MRAAMKEVACITSNYGTQIEIHDSTESNIVRDEYASIIAVPSTFTAVYAFPILFNPTRKDLEKAGIAEHVDVIMYVARKEFLDKGLSYASSLDVGRTRIIYKVPGVTGGTEPGMQFTLKEKSLISQFGGEYLYVVLGCMKK